MADDEQLRIEAEHRARAEEEAYRTPGPGSSLGHVPAFDRWEFDETVARCCADMMARSVPGYEEMRRHVGLLVDHFVRPKTAIVELGAGDGEGIAQLARRYPENRFYAIEHAPAMLKALRERLGARQNVRIVDRDLALPAAPGSATPTRVASVVLSVLALQFVASIRRQAVLDEACRALVPGGAMLLVEKVESPPLVAQALVQAQRKIKVENGYTEQEIRAKDDALRGVLVPWTVDANVRALRLAGFDEVECFWRGLNFAGFVAVKS